MEEQQTHTLAPDLLSAAIPQSVERAPTRAPTPDPVLLTAQEPELQAVVQEMVPQAVVQEMVPQAVAQEREAALIPGRIMDAETETYMLTTDTIMNITLKRKRAPSGDGSLLL